MPQGGGSSPPLPSVVRLSTKREEEVVVRSPSKGLKELSGEDEKESSSRKSSHVLPSACKRDPVLPWTEASPAAKLHTGWWGACIPQRPEDLRFRCVAQAW